MQQLHGHKSEQTAYLVPRFPYHYGQFTSVRFWIETKEPYGQRVCTQILDPFKLTWYKPKYSGYTDLIFLFLENDPAKANLGLITVHHINFEYEPYLENDEALKALSNTYILDEYQQNRIFAKINDNSIKRKQHELWMQLSKLDNGGQND